MSDVEAILEDAGARWRASQLPPPAIDIGAVLDAAERRRRSRWHVFRNWALGVAVVVVAAAALAVAGGSRPSVPAGVTPSPGGRAGCDVTHPEPVFVPPSDYLSRYPRPLAKDPMPGSSWFGSAHLWVSLAVAGESWGPPGLGRSFPITQKTFWWSADWFPDAEPQPAISVTGTRLDGPGSFRFGDPGTNASAEFGTAMLVGIDIPREGCWQITGRYRTAELSYVVWVAGD
jgi:hypothetical protein